jgi:photosystem II stability/assembly factor-like uncharacterized protein
MMALELAMRDHWRPRGAIAPGGTVLGIALGAPEQVWLATDAGVWQRDAGRWRSLGLGLPLHATALVWANGLLIAGSASGGILYSGDNGRSWYTAWVDETISAVTCFAVSPSLSSGQILLAGTDGAGILRSTDGGRRWHIANVGLSDFTVLALAMAPVWEPREIVFAATDDAVYRSPNGGRAWKRADRGMERMRVQTLAVSPAFATDGTVYAGTEQHDIYRSVDGGDSWQPLAAAASSGMINSLWCDLIDSDGVPMLIAGTGDGTLIRSTDRGESWSVVATEGWSVLALTGNGGCIYAGLNDRGLLFSDDAGLTWQLDDQLAARDITRLAVCEDHSLLAYGPAGGLWCSDGAYDWRSLVDLEGLGTLFALTCSHQAGWFVATDAGLFHSTDAGVSWQSSLEPTNSRISVVTSNATWPAELWVGANDGAIWHSDDGGRQWNRLAAVPNGQPIVALATSRESSGGRMLVAASFDLLDQRVTIWYSTDAGVHWEPWLADNSTWPRVTICLGHDIDDQACISVGSRLWNWNSAQWQSFEPDGTPVTALLHIPGTTTSVAATAGGMYVSPDGRSWEALEGAPSGLIDIAITPDSASGPTILGLEPGGVVWEWPLRSVPTIA